MSPQALHYSCRVKILSVILSQEIILICLLWVNNCLIDIRDFSYLKSPQRGNESTSVMTCGALGFQKVAAEVPTKEGGKKDIICSIIFYLGALN